METYYEVNCYNLKFEYEASFDAKEYVLHSPHTLTLYPLDNSEPIVFLPLNNLVIKIKKKQ